jgi:Arc/MetJ-type ribon-helix-helix transcriptional regulator
MTKKIAVSLPDRTLARAKAVVKKGRAESVSGYIASLIDREADEESFEEMIARWNREDGREPADVARGRAAVRADFERAGLVAKGSAGGKALP